MMNSSLRIPLAGAALVVLALAGCSTSSGTAAEPEPSASESESPSATPEPSESETPAASSAELTTADSPLGEIIVDAKGMTAYYFDKDVPNSGSSSCSGECAVAWPSITAASATPAVDDGITATVGTITGVAGETQITVNGLPIYLFQKDAAPGDVNGQGVGDVWWVIAPDGTKITDPLPQ
jgi:predicted lipoprotein with Yx(FWY)xxD motif